MKKLIVRSCSGFNFSTDLEDRDEIECVQIQKPEAAPPYCLRNTKARYSTGFTQYLTLKLLRENLSLFEMKTFITDQIFDEFV